MMAVNCCFGPKSHGSYGAGGANVGTFGQGRFRLSLGEMSMSGARYNRVLASTALALVLAVPLGAAAQEAGKLAPTAEAGDSSAPLAIPSAPPAAPPQPATPAATTETTATATPTAPAVAAEPAAAPDPLASLDPADRAVAEKIRDLLAAKVDKIFVSKKERTAVEAFYNNRNLAPLWLDKGVENARAKAVAARMKAADADGLVASEYKSPNFAAASGPDAQAEAELKLTQTVLTFARHLQAGRFPYQRVSNNNIELPQAPPDAAEVLTKIADASNAAAALDSFSPPHEAYQALKKALAEMRGKAGGEGKEIADGALLKLVAKTPMEDPRV